LSGRIAAMSPAGTRFEVTSATSLRVLQLLVALSRKWQLELKPAAAGAPYLQYLAGLLAPDAADPAMAATQRAWQADVAPLEKWHDTLEKFRSAAKGPITTSDLRKLESKMVSERLDLYGWRAPPYTQESGAASRRNLRWMALRGMSPELQAPLLAGLREVFREPPEAQRLLNRLAGCSEVWPTDLMADALKPGERVSDTFLVTLCHYADRFGALPLIFEEAPEGSPIAGVERIHSAYSELIGASPDALPAVRAAAKKRSRRRRR